MEHNASFAATIGFFDGVHKGHQFLINRLNEMAHRIGQQSMVITFDRHPRQVVHADYVPQLITPLNEKLRLLNLTGANRIEVLHFDTSMAALSAHDFMLEVLHRQLGVGTLLIGYDNRFGHNRAEDFDDYLRYGHDMGINVVQNTPIDVEGMRVSSSLVRRLLAEGDVSTAATFLGRRFEIEGTVEHGFAEGRKIDFPTANLHPDCGCQLLPSDGVYTTRICVDGGPWLKAMTNIGTNPTFERSRQTIETHIIDFNANIYGQHARIEFCQRLRGEQKFGSVEELKAQLQRDREATLAYRY